jgi:hypothetical protein
MRDIRTLMASWEHVCVATLFTTRVLSSSLKRDCQKTGILCYTYIRPGGAVILALPSKPEHRMPPQRRAGRSSCSHACT